MSFKLNWHLSLIDSRCQRVSAVEIVLLFLMWLYSLRIFICFAALRDPRWLEEWTNRIFCRFSLSRNLSPWHHCLTQWGIASDAQKCALYVNEGNAQGSKRSARRDRNRNKSHLQTYKSINSPLQSQVETLTVPMSLKTAGLKFCFK